MLPDRGGRPADGDQDLGDFPGGIVDLHFRLTPPERNWIASLVIET